MDYKAAGVNIDEANDAKKRIAEEINGMSKIMLNKVGAFASLLDADLKSYQDPILVMKTEEPGSKQSLAAKYGRINSVCVDMINHLINDCIVTGATPLAVQDAIICGKLVKEEIAGMIKAMADACRAQDCALVGGETSEQPGVLPPGEFILTSSIIGIAERYQLFADTEDVRAYLDVIALQSSGPHTNGYTLIRQLIKDHPEILDKNIGGRSFIDAVLEPHRCYYRAVKNLKRHLDDFKEDLMIRGMAHITGGGIKENLNRILRPDVDAVVDLSLFPTQEVFKVIAETGDVPQEDMLRTFNMGVGMVVLCVEERTLDIVRHLKKHNILACKIGETAPGSGIVRTTGKFNYA